MKRDLQAKANPKNQFFLALAILLFFLTFFIPYASFSDEGRSSGFQARRSQLQVISDATKMILEGRQTFRYETFGDEAFWGDTLRLHEAIAGETLGGVGGGVSPIAALGVGLKVDSEALSRLLKRKIIRGEIDLNSPATTLALLKSNAVVGLTGIFDRSGKLQSMGIQCALCHSTVDDSFAPGIGKRLDGWANQDLDVGAIIALAPDLSFFTDLLPLSEDTVRTVLQGWGPGKFDAHLLLDGQSAPTLIPPAFGLLGVNLHTWTGWGSVTHWNAFVAVLEMGGKVRFTTPD